MGRLSAKGSTKVAKSSMCGAGAGAAASSRKPKVRPATKRADASMTVSLALISKLPQPFRSDSITKNPPRATYSETDLRKYLDMDGTPKHYPCSMHISPKRTAVPLEVSCAIHIAAGKEIRISDHHMIDIRSMNFLYNIIFSAYTSVRCGPDSWKISKNELKYTRAMLDLVQLSGVLINPIIRFNIGFPAIDLSALSPSVRASAARHFCFDDEAAKAFLLKLESVGDDTSAARDHMLNELRREIAWAPWNLVPGPEEKTSRLDPAACHFDDFAASAELVEGFPKSALQRFYIARQLYVAIQDSCQYLEENVKPFRSRKGSLEAHNNAQLDRVNLICDLIKRLKTVSMGDYLLRIKLTKKSSVMVLRVNQGPALALWKFHKEGMSSKLASVVDEGKSAPPEFK